MSRPLVVSADPALVEALTRLCAAAGVSPELVDDTTRALAAWAPASVVLVGPDRAGAMAATAPPRRAGVHLVSLGALPDHRFRDAVALGVEGVVELPAGQERVLELLADATEVREPDGITVGVVGGSGGVGASSFAGALSVAAAVHGHTVLLDLDLLGGGADTLLGLEDVDGVRWSTLGQSSGRISARTFREALPRDGGPGVLTWTAGRRRMPPAFAVREVVAAATRGHRTVVLDLPRHADPVVDEVAARCTHLLLVVRADLLGVAAGLRQAQRLAELGSVRLVVRGPASRAVEVEKALGQEALALVPEQRGLVEAVELGLGPVRSPRSGLARAARRVLATLDDVSRQRAA